MFFERLRPSVFGTDLFRLRRLHDEFHGLRRLVGVMASKPPVQVRTALLFLGTVALALAATLAMLTTDLPREAAFMAGIFVLAALLWVTELLPLFATALLVIGLQIILLANPGEWAGLGFESGSSPAYRTFLAPISDPIIILFLGGFLMARAAIAEGVDKALAGVILKLSGTRPAMVMMGLMGATALFSMWMSNTATTAMMITLTVPMLAQIPHKDPLRKGLVLAIPFAANIGGMGTPISSPPNAVAVAFLSKAGLEVSFLDWMLIAVPLMLGLLAGSWLLLTRLYPPSSPDLKLKPVAASIDRAGVFVLVVMGVTILLWLTDAIHGLPTAVVALVPAIAFTATGLIGRKDFNSLEWHILILIAGGIALGVGLRETGLDAAVTGVLPGEGRAAVIALVVATMLFSTFMSNTAAANLLLPIGVSLAVGVAGEGSAEGAYVLAISIALAASTAMALPISTPPNAIAYAHGELETRDLALSGVLVGGVALLLIVLFGGPIIRFWL
jgi:sodium-dependent dicarboxylate transporter 2/3/5